MFDIFYFVNQYYNSKGINIFDNINISKWDVSNVTHMNYMFEYCRQFDQQINYWNVSNVKYIEKYVFNCTIFNQNLNDYRVKG